MVLKPSKTAYPETMQYVLNQGSDARAALRIKFPGASIAPPPEDPAKQGSVNDIVMFPSPGSGRRMPYENMTISLTG